MTRIYTREVECPVCGKVLPRSKAYLDGCCSSKCFHTNFWNEIVADKENHVFINGESYKIEKDDPDNLFQGFGGKKFKIEFFDGTVVETKNLWAQGTVPEEFKEKLPDTAKFI